MEKRADHSRATRTKLIEVGSLLFAERGFDGVSVREIVAAAGVNLGAITYHFGGKDGLFAAVVARRIEPMLSMGREVAARQAGPIDKLRLIMERYALHILHTDPSLRVLFAAMLAGARRFPREAAEALAWRNELFAVVMREGIRDGIFRPFDVECAAWIFFGMLAAYVLHEPVIVGGVKMSRVGAYDPEYVRRVVGVALDIFLQGVLSPQHRAAGDCGLTAAHAGGYEHAAPVSAGHEVVQ
jgi:AcrR family transcriptional regulator